MEPGIPDPTSRASRLGKYNLDPAVRFWATPPVHGILRPTVVHPADFTFKLPDNVSLRRRRDGRAARRRRARHHQGADQAGRRRRRHRRRPDRHGHACSPPSPPAAPGSSSATSTTASSPSPSGSARSPARWSASMCAAASSPTSCMQGDRRLGRRRRLRVLRQREGRGRDLRPRSARAACAVMIGIPLVPVRP